MDEEGNVLDIYEQATLSTDDGFTTDKTFFPALSLDECIAFSRQQADGAIDQFHTVYHPYFHPIRTRPGPLSTQRWLEAMLRYAKERGFHCVSGVDWVAFNDARRAMRLVTYHFDAEALTLTLTLEAERAVKGSTLVFPHICRGHALTSATVDGEPVAVTPQVVEGREQVLLPADYTSGQARRWHLRWGPGSP